MIVVAAVNATPTGAFIALHKYYEIYSSVIIRCQFDYSEMFDEAQEYFSSFLGLHMIDEEVRREDDECLENVSGYFNVGGENEENKELVEEEQEQEKVEEGWRWTRVGSQCGLMIIKLAFVAFFVMVLTNHHFNQSSQRLLPYASNFTINILQ